MYNKVLENAYPEINLHDCEIKNLTYEGNAFYIYFPDGVFLDGQTRSEGDAKIVIKNLCREDASFTVSKICLRIKGRYPIYVTQDKSIKDIKKLLDKGYYFTIIDEYYQNGEIFWKGVIESFKKNRTKSWGCFEFIFYSDNLIYYYNDLDKVIKS